MSYIGDEVFDAEEIFAPAKKTTKKKAAEFEKPVKRNEKSSDYADQIYSEQIETVKAKKITKKIPSVIIKKGPLKKKKIVHNEEDDVLDMSNESFEEDKSSEEDESPVKPKNVQFKKHIKSMVLEESDEEDYVLKIAKPLPIVETKEERKSREFYATSKKLEALSETFDFNDETNFPESQLEEMLDSLEKIWTPEDYQDEVEMDNITHRALGMEGKNEVDPRTIEDAMDQRVFVPLANLQFRFSLANMINCPEHERNEEYKKRFQKLWMLQSYSVEIYYNKVLRRCHFLNPDLDVTGTIGLKRFEYLQLTCRYAPRQDDADMTDFVKILIWSLLKLQTKKCRRYKESIFRPVYNEKGFYTNAWEKHPTHGTIEEFVWEAVDIDRQGHIFMVMYSKGSCYPEQLIKVLKYIKTNYFPELKPIRYLSSWKNGIYNTAEDTFYPYNNTNPYTKGSVKPAQHAEEDLAVTLSDLKKLSTKLPKFSNVFESVAKDLLGSKGEDKNGAIFLGSSFCSHIFIDQEFIDQHNVDWKNIQTDGFQGILDSQQYEDETCRWFYALLGRGLYWCGDMNKENWQVVPIFLGHSGTGKSTALKYLRQFFKIENVGILSNNIERQWAMSSLIDKYVVIGYEIKADFKWDQAEFQQCAACEELLVAKKHKDAFVTTWKAPIFMAANEMIKVWRDNSGSLKRRLVVFPFNYYVPPSHINPNLMEILMDEFSLWIQKINKAYISASLEYGKKDIWSILPKELQDASEQTMQTVHPLQHFFAENSHRIVTDSELYVSVKVFREEFKIFCEANGYEYNKIKWQPDLYKPVFDKRTPPLRIESMEISQLGGKTMKSENFIFGMAFKDENHEVTTTENQ